jgi:hypothetical protein
MLTADGCTDAPIIIEGTTYTPRVYGTEWGMRRSKQRCGDCNVLPGRIHHHGCDLEDCPACGGQSISCGCVWAGEEHLTEDWLEEMEERLQRIGPDE